MQCAFTLKTQAPGLCGAGSACNVAGTCYYPLRIWRGDTLPSGKREILFNPPHNAGATLYEEKVPCGKCIGCKLERSRQWAMRIVHEASLYEQNSFLTLTYDDKNLPQNGSLVKSDYQKFMKRLRKSVSPKRVRFFHCGEYGEKLGRPHYHSILFNHDFIDKSLYKTTSRGDRLYTSEALSNLWTAGHALIGEVTFESAAYVARYTIEKINVSAKSPDRIKKQWEEKYLVSKKTGELREPEYVTMSRRPGIGKNWFEKYTSDIYPQDYAIIRGMKVRPPKYYDGLYEQIEPTNYLCIKKNRIINSLKMDPIENTSQRLAVKEIVKLAQLRSLSRKLGE